MKRLIVKGITTAMLVTALVFPPVTSAFAHTSPPPATTCEQTNALEIPGNAAECFSMHGMPTHMMNNPMGGMMGGM